MKFRTGLQGDDRLAEFIVPNEKGFVYLLIQIFDIFGSRVAPGLVSGRGFIYNRSIVQSWLTTTSLFNQEYDLMKRREFFAASAAMTAGTCLSGTTAFAEKTGDREYIRVKTYWTRNDDDQARLIEKLDKWWIPYLNNYGFSKVGIFTVNRELHKGDKSYDSKYDRAVFTFTSHLCFEKFRDVNADMARNMDKSQYLNQSTEKSLYENLQSELLYAFPHCPKLAVPSLSPDRVVQFRRYYSPNVDRNAAKLRMFDVRGELALFRKCGQMPVFFGEMIFGEWMQNISYMLSFENDEARRTAWSKFIGSDEWKTMKAEDEFKDTATKIRNLFFKPSPGSQI